MRNSSFHLSSIKVGKHSYELGGSSIVTANESTLIFGGANREGVAFADTIHIMKSITTPKVIQLNVISPLGDLPIARSGHSMCSYHEYIFLSGGINFMEELVFDSLQVYNTVKSEWKYVGESGEKIRPRNSHSMVILQPLIRTQSYRTNQLSQLSHHSIYTLSNDNITDINDNNNNDTNKMNYMIIWGGASPEYGPMNDGFYAMLPQHTHEIEKEDFYVTWHKIISSNGKYPSPREMHSTTVINNQCMIICGGRNEKGEILNDIWILYIKPQLVTTTATATTTHSSFSSSNTSSHTHIDTTATNVTSTMNTSSTATATVTATSSTTTNSIEFIWEEIDSMKLTIGRCAHTASILHNRYLCLYGGFTSEGEISNEMICIDYITHLSFLDTITLPTTNTTTTTTSNNNNNNNNNKIDTAVSNWTSVGITPPLEPRFGSCMCIAPTWYNQYYHDKYNLKNTSNTSSSSIGNDSTVFTSLPITDSLQIHESTEECNMAADIVKSSLCELGGGFLLFGGVNAEKDFNDLVYLRYESA